MLEDNYFYKSVFYVSVMVSYDYSLKRNVCDSFLLNFDKPLRILGDRVFTIPSNDSCESIFIMATKELSGDSSNRGEYFSNYISILEKENKLSKRVSDALYNSFSGYRDETNFFEHHLSGVSGYFDSNFFMGFGSLYRYYPKAKENAIKNIESFFDKNELKSLKTFSDLIKKNGKIFWDRKLERNN
jgi:hypothetical protein